MTTVIGGSSPSITFSDSTTQSTAALPLTGGQLSGNLTFATGTNGIVFNNSSASVNSTLNDYETGTWTPTDQSGASLTFSGASGYYTKVGRLVTFYLSVTYPTTANTSGAQISIPFQCNSGTNNGMAYITYSTYSTTTNNYVSNGNSYLVLQTAGSTSVQNVALSGKRLDISGFYQANF